MEVKPFLNHVRESLLQVEVLCARAEKLREMAVRAGGQKGITESPEPFVIALMDAHAELQEKVSRLIMDSRVAEKMIETLENGNQRAVLQLHYLCGYSWVTVADKIHFTLRYVHALKDAGIAELEKTFHDIPESNGGNEQ